MPEEFTEFYWSGSLYDSEEIPNIDVFVRGPQIRLGAIEEGLLGDTTRSVLLNLTPEEAEKVGNTLLQAARKARICQQYLPGIIYQPLPDRGPYAEGDVIERILDYHADGGDPYQCGWEPDYIEDAEGHGHHGWVRFDGKTQ